MVQMTRRPTSKRMLSEKKLTPAEKKKREEIARAIERENPDMPMDKKMAIATATAKRVAEAMDDDDKKSVDTSRAQRTGDFKMVKYKDPNTGQTRWRKQKKEFKVESVQEAKDMYRSAAQELKTYADKSGGMDKKDFHTAAKHIENIGKANIMNKGQHLAKFSKHLRDLDTSPREKVLSVLHKHGHEVGDYMPGVKMKKRVGEEVQENNSAPQTAAHRRAMMVGVDRPKKVKLKGFGPDQAKGNMGNPAARASLKVEAVEEGSPARLDMIRKAAEKYNKQKKAAERKAERDAKKAMSKDADLGENNNAPQKDKPPFEGPYTKAGPKKDKFGNTIKVQNMAKKLARKGMDSVADESVSEALHPDHVSLHPHKTKKTHYTVGQVGRNVKGRLKTGEHLNDTQVDDLHDMGMKVKHERKPLGEADFDTNFKKRIALKVSGPKSVRDYMKTKVDQHKAAHAKQDPRAVKQGYGPGVIPPGTAFRAARKRGMNPSQAANAVSNAFKNRSKPRKLPEETEIHEAVINTLQDIVKTKGAKEVKFKDGRKMKVDMQSANMLTKVHKSLNSTNAKKFADALDKGQNQFMKMLDFAYSVTR